MPSSFTSQNLYKRFIYSPLVSFFLLFFILSFLDFITSFYIFDIKKLYIINVHNLVSLVKSKHPWNYQHSLCHKAVHHLQKFPATLYYCFSLLLHVYFLPQSWCSNLHHIALSFSTPNYEFNLFSLIFQGATNSAFVGKNELAEDLVITARNRKWKF